MNEREIFFAALQIDTPEGRAAYLQRACDDDIALRRKVEQLLKEHFSNDSLLSHPAPERPEPNAPTSPPEQAPAQMLGRYKLLEKIGEGGFGEVWMAEQREPVKRRVALKIIKLGMDSRQIVARFEAERQALAMMDHANIARIFDADVTDTGRPYFVMELVRGMKITDYCDRNQLPTQERLKLFILVCQAIQHAHQKGIIHRDIKPSNILVTLHDGVPVPKVIDFGIAKATQQELTDKTVFTQFQQFIGTPAYISPEQAEMSGLDIDTRADIYSLGVLLYELLVGKTPFDAKEMIQGGLEALRQIIREKEPLRPSTRLNTLQGDARTTAGKCRQTDIGKLVHQLAGDLDWIVMKCLEKDRSRRYETANGLAADIQRHLANEPVIARPPSRLYEFQKTVRRHKFGFAAATAVLLALALGGLFSALQAVRATRAEHQQSLLRGEAQQSAIRAEGEAKRAEANANEAEKQRQQAEAFAEENRINLYAARIKLIAQTIDEGDASHAQELLESLRPRKGQKDLRSFDWYYLHQLASSEKSALTRIGGRVRSVTFSPDGQWMAAAGEDRVVRLWSAKTQQLRGQLKGHTKEVAALAFTPDGKTLASAGADGSVRLWNVATAESLHTWQASSNSLAAMAFSQDGNWLAVGEGGGPVKWGTPFTRYASSQGAGRVLVWNMKTHQLERSLDAHCCGVLSLTFSPDGKQLATGGVDRKLELFQVESGKRLLAQTNFSGPVFAALFLPGGEIAAASWNPYSESGRITIFEASTLEQKRVMLFAGKATCLALSPDGRTLASAGPDRVLRLLDVVTGEEAGVFHGHKAEIWSVAYSPNGKTVATGGFDDSIRLWDAASHPARQSLRSQNTFSVAFSPDGKLLACSGGTVEIREAATGALLRRLPGYTNADVRVAFSPDGATLAATDYDNTVHFWDVATWNHWSPQKSDLPQPPQRGDSFSPDNQLVFSPDSTTLARGGVDGSIRLWNARTGELIGKLDNSAASLGFTPDGTRLVGAHKNELRVWNMMTKQVESRARGSGALRISRDGEWVACSGASEVSIRHLPDLNVVRTMRGHRETVYCVNFSHDGKILATASWDGTVKLWQVATGQELFTIPSRVGVVWSVAFAPDDRSLAFASGTGAMEGAGAVSILRCASAERVSKQQEVWAASLSESCDHLARAANWKGALEAMKELVELEPTNHWNYHRLGPLFLTSGDLEGYRQTSQQIKTQFLHPESPIIAERMAKTCLILPSSGVDADTISKWMETALSPSGRGTNDLWNRFVKGLAEYRLNHFVDAAQWVEIVANSEPPPTQTLKAQACMVLAMARWQLKQSDAAHAALATGNEIIEQKLDWTDEEWSNRIMAQALHREARLLIDGKAPSDPFKRNR